MGNRQQHQMEKKMAEKIRTGLLGGTFNPIHIGHLALANYLCEYENLDELWFLVTPLNPFKRNFKLADDQIRLQMVQAAIADYNKFHASDFEFHLPKPSYTIHTLHKLSESFPEREFILIIGSDNWQVFNQWKSPEEIIQKYQILIYPRPNYEISPETLPHHVKMVHTPLLEISSSFIRESIAKGKDIRYFLHPETYRIIRENLLYRDL